MKQSASQTFNSRVSPPLLCCNAGDGATRIYQWYKRTLSDAASSTLRLSRCAELSWVRAARSQLARLGCGEGGRGVRTAGSRMGERGGYLWEDLWRSHAEDISQLRDTRRV